MYAHMNPAARARTHTQRKDYIIARLNADAQKVYFGRTIDGRVCELDEMTYRDVLHRCIALMHVPARAATSTSAATPARWIHASYAARVWRFAQRMAALLTSTPRRLQRTHELLRTRAPSADAATERITTH